MPKFASSKLFPQIIRNKIFQFRGLGEPFSPCRGGRISNLADCLIPRTNVICVFSIPNLLLTLLNRCNYSASLPGWPPLDTSRHISGRFQLFRDLSLPPWKGTDLTIRQLASLFSLSVLCSMENPGLLVVFSCLPHASSLLSCKVISSFSTFNSSSTEPQLFGSHISSSFCWVNLIKWFNISMPQFCYQNKQIFQLNFPWFFSWPSLQRQQTKLFVSWPPSEVPSLTQGQSW